MAIFEEPIEPFAKVGQPIDELLVEHLYRNERQQPDERSHAEGDFRSVDVQMVVVESVLLVPEPDPPRVLMASVIRTKWSKNFDAMSSYSTWSARVPAPSTACSPQ